MFESESYLDRHLKLRHGNEFRPNATRCLATLCPLLHCDYFAHVSSASNDCHDAPARLEKIQCEVLMHKCFPSTESAEAAALYAFARQTLCEAHVCDAMERQRVLRDLDRRVRPKRFLYDLYAMIIILSVVVYWTVLLCRP